MYSLRSVPLRQFLLLLPGRAACPLSLDGVCHSGVSHSVKVVTVVPCRETSTGVTGLRASAISAPRLPAHPPFIRGNRQQRMREGDGCIAQFDLSVEIEKVLALQQSETFALKTNILPHQESNFLSKQFSLNISKQPRVSIDLNCYKREKNEALSLQRSCLPTN